MTDQDAANAPGTHDLDAEQVVVVGPDGQPVGTIPASDRKSVV